MSLRGAHAVAAWSRPRWTRFRHERAIGECARQIRGSTSPRAGSAMRRWRSARSTWGPTERPRSASTRATAACSAASQFVHAQQVSRCDADERRRGRRHAAPRLIHDLGGRAARERGTGGRRRRDGDLGGEPGSPDRAIYQFGHGEFRTCVAGLAPEHRRVGRALAQHRRRRRESGFRDRAGEQVSGRALPWCPSSGFDGDFVSPYHAEDRPRAAARSCSARSPSPVLV